MKVNTHFLGVRRRVIHRAADRNSGFERGKGLTSHSQDGKTNAKGVDV